MMRVKPPFTPGLEAELMGRDRGLKQTRGPAEKGARHATTAYGSGSRGKTSRLRQGSALILIHIGASTATGVTVTPAQQLRQ